MRCFLVAQFHSSHAVFPISYQLGRKPPKTQNYKKKQSDFCISFFSAIFSSNQLLIFYAFQKIITHSKLHVYISIL